MESVKEKQSPTDIENRLVAAKGEARWGRDGVGGRD